MICGDLHWKEIGKRVDVCTHITDAFCCTPEANTTLQSNYTPIKCNERKKTRGTKHMGEIEKSPEILRKKSTFRKYRKQQRKCLKK